MRYIVTDFLWSKIGFMNQFFSAWPWKVYDLQSYVHAPLIEAMEDACNQTDVVFIQEWIQHSRRFFHQYLAYENIAYDVDEAVRTDAMGCFIFNPSLCMSVVVAVNKDVQI